MPNPIDIASAQVGARIGPNTSQIQEYLRNGGANLDPTTTAWCAAFVNSTLQQAGLKGTGSNLARSFLDYGTPVQQPQRGDIAVFSRGDPNGPLGHVGFVDSYSTGPDGQPHVRLLAGNQGHSVSIADYGGGHLLGFRHPGDTTSGSPPQPPARPTSLADAFDPNAQQQAAAAPGPGGPAAPPPTPSTLADALQPAGGVDLGYLAPPPPSPIAQTFADVGNDMQKRQQDQADADQKRRVAMFAAGNLGLAHLFATT